MKFYKHQKQINYKEKHNKIILLLGSLQIDINDVISSTGCNES